MRAQNVVRNQTNPANFYGWYGKDMTSRATNRAGYFSRGSIYSELCGSASLYLDSFLQVKRGRGPIARSWVPETLLATDFDNL